MTEQTRPNMALLEPLPDYAARQRTPLDDNFDDTQVIEGLDVGDTTSFDPIQPTTLLEAVPASQSAPLRPREARGEGKTVPRVPRPSEDRREAGRRSLSGWLLFQIADFWRIFLEGVTDPRALARFLSVVLPIALCAAFTTNQLFGPQTGPLSNLRLPVEMLRPLDVPTQRPTLKPSRLVRQPVIPAIRRNSPLPVKSSSKPVTPSAPPSPRTTPSPVGSVAPSPSQDPTQTPPTKIPDSPSPAPVEPIPESPESVPEPSVETSP